VRRAEAQLTAAPMREVVTVAAARRSNG